MSENGGEVTVPSGTFSAEETLIGNLGEGEGEKEGEGVEKGEEGAFLVADGGEIMVEVVGSDVFVDGVGGSEREEGGTGEGESGVSGNLNVEEVGDLISQEWDALTANGVEDVEQGEVMVHEEDLERGEDLTKEGGDHGVMVGEANSLETEIGVAAAAVIVKCSSGETQVVAEEVPLTERLGTEETGLATEGVEQAPDCGHGEANVLDYLTSGQDVVLNVEGWNPANETEVLCSAGMAQTATTQTEFVSEEVALVTNVEVLMSKYKVQDSVVSANILCTEVDESSHFEMVEEATDEGAVNADVGNLEQLAENVGGEIGMVSKEECLRAKDVVEVTEVVDGELHSSSARHMLSVKAVKIDDGNSSDPIVEVPNNVSLSVDGGNAFEAKGSFDEEVKVAAVCSVDIDNEVSVLVSSDHHADKILTVENREIGCSIVNVDNVEDQSSYGKAVGESSETDVAPCTVPASSDDQTQYASTVEATAEVSTSVVGALTISDMGSFVVCSNEAKTVMFENEISGNANEHGVVPAELEASFEEARADGGEGAGMDIDEVMYWKDEVPENNALDSTLINPGIDEILVDDKVAGSSETKVVLGVAKSPDESTQITDEGEAASMDIDEKEEANDNDDYEPKKLGFVKGDFSLSEVDEIGKASAQLVGTRNVSNVLPDSGISVENDAVAGEETAMITDEEDVNFKSEVMHLDMGLQKDENINSLVVCPSTGNECAMQENADSSGEQARVETLGALESGSQGNFQDSSCDTPEVSNTPSGKDKDSKIETVAGGSIKYDSGCRVPLVVTDEILNEGTLFGGHPDSAVAGEGGAVQAALTSTSAHSKDNSDPSCNIDFAAPLADGIGSLEVQMLSTDSDASLCTNALETHHFDGVNSNDLLSQVTEAKDESSKVDSSPSLLAHTFEVKGLDITDSEPVIDHSTLAMDACPDKEEKRKSHAAADNENTSLPYEVNCGKDDSESWENNVQKRVSECLDGTEADDLAGIGPIAGQAIEAEEGYTDREQVDFQEKQEDAPEAENSTAIDEKEPELHNPLTPVPVHQSFYLQPPEIDEEQVEEAYTDGEQVDFQEEREDAADAENSTATDEKEPELHNPLTSVPVHQSFYLQPPEIEGEFSVADLVWGKVRSHPWWPGQIFNPVDASEKAMKYFKKDCFLVAYFGDRTFAWNDSTVLKPFRAHFSQIEKQNNSEAFQHAVSCALHEVSRRVELGLACSCIPLNTYDKIKSQVVENTGIKPELSRRYGVDKSAGVSSFEPDKLLDYVKALAHSPYGGSGTDQLELVIAKAQLSSFSRYKGYGELPEFQFSGELLESDADTLELNEAIEHPASACKDGEQVLVDKGKLKSENSLSHKRKHMDTVYPSKKEKNLSDLMVDTASSTDGEDGPDGQGMSKLVSTTGKKRKDLDSVLDGLDKSKNFSAAKVSSVAFPTPKPSFKIGECIRRAASQLTGSPSILKGGNEKFLKVDVDDGQPTGFEVSVQTPGTSPRKRMNVSTDYSSVDEMLSQLHLAAHDPMKGYSFLNTIIPFFSSYRTSVISKSRRQNSSAGRSGSARKRKASNDVSNTPEEFEFDDVNDSYWTDRIIQNYSEEQLLLDSQNGVNYQLVTLEPSKPVKSGRKSRKRFSSGTPGIQPEEPAEHVDRRKQDLPTELVLNFAIGVSVPAEMNLNKTFRRFGPLMESETEVDVQASRARVVFKRCSDAEVAYSSAGKFNIFGSKLVNYELNYSPLVSYKPLPLATLQGPEDAT